MFNWDKLPNIMKVDGTAIDEWYFMSTHTPFKNLLCIDGGKMDNSNLYLSENEVFNKLFVNTDRRQDQLVIVRGSNGTGKSHLIRWIYKKLEHDKSISDNARIIFLKRAENSVKGALRQILKENIIKDSVLTENLKKFIYSTENLSKGEFMQKILDTYLQSIRYDKSDDAVYDEQGERDDFVSFIRYKPVEKYFLRDGGPIDKCFNLINNSAQNIINNGDDPNLIFTEKDFNFSRELKRELNSNRVPDEISIAYENIYDEDTNDNISNIVNWLNRFTNKVLQACTNISANTTKDIFFDLRKDLKANEQNLILFIEDFTSFTLLESELITALSVEKGGEYDDLCNVTSVIGMTDAYYGNFKDNYQDRVTWQIEVTKEAFGTEDFLVNLAGRYVNSYYCDPEKIKEWYRLGADPEALPICNFKLSYEWDSTDINGNQVTLFPFNKECLVKIYNKLDLKSPRDFLRYVVDNLIHQFANQREVFPFIKVKDYVSATYLKNIEDSNLSADDKVRLNNVLAYWGNKTTEDDGKSIGGIEKEFLVEIGLGNFSGIEVQDGVSVYKTHQKENISLKQGEQNFVKTSSKYKKYNDIKENLNAWINGDDKFIHLEPKKALTEILQKDIINEIPEFYYHKIIGAYGQSRALITIDGDGSKTRGLLHLERSLDTFYLLSAMIEKDYAKSWDFQGASFYQYVLSEWIIKTRKYLIEYIKKDYKDDKYFIITKYCLALRYWQNILNGKEVAGSNYEIAKILVNESAEDKDFKHSNKIWNDILESIKQDEAWNDVNAFLKFGINNNSNSFKKSTSGEVERFYRTDEILIAVKELEEKQWDISSELDKKGDIKLFNKIIELLAKLYKKMKNLLNEQQSEGRRVVTRLENQLGNNITENNLLRTVETANSFYGKLREANIKYAPDVASDIEKYDDVKKLNKLIKDYTVIVNMKNASLNDLLNLSCDPVNRLTEFVKLLEKIEKDADDNIDNNLIHENRLNDSSINESIKKIDSLIKGYRKVAL